MKLSHLVSLLIFTTVPALAADTATYTPIQVERKVLKNGMHLLVVPEAGQTTSLQAWFQAGAYEEKPQYLGLSHLNQHLMIFGPTKKAKEESKKLFEEKKIDFDGKASRSYTGIWFVGPQAQLDTMVESFEKKRTQFDFDDESFKGQIEYTGKERDEKVAESKKGKIADEVPKLLYPKSPMGNSVFGENKTIQAITPQVSREFAEKYYTPSRTSIVAIGEIPAQKLSELTSKWESQGTGAAKKSSVREEVKETQLKANLKKKIEWERNENAKAVTVAFRGPAFKSADWTGLHILGQLLKARLARAEKEITAESFAWVYQLMPQGVLSFSFIGQPNSSTEQLMVRLKKEVDQMSSANFTDEELEAAKNSYLTEFQDSVKDAKSKGHTLGSAEALGGFEFVVPKLETVQSFHKKEAVKLAKKYLSGPQLNLTIESHKASQP